MSNSCARVSKAQTGEFLREKLMYDLSCFFPTRVNKKRRTGKNRGAFSEMYRTLDGWMLARALSSTAQRIHHHVPRYLNFRYFCTIFGLDKLGRVDQIDWGVICPL